MYGLMERTYARALSALHEQRRPRPRLRLMPMMEAVALQTPEVVSGRYA